MKITTIGIDLAKECFQIHDGLIIGYQYRAHA